MELAARSLLPPQPVAFHGFCKSDSVPTAQPHLLLPQFPHRSKKGPCAPPAASARTLLLRVTSRPTSKQGGDAEDVFCQNGAPAPGHPLSSAPSRGVHTSSLLPSLPPAAGDLPKAQRGRVTHLALNLRCPPAPPPDLRMEFTRSPPSSRLGPNSPHLQASLTALQPRWPLFCPQTHRAGPGLRTSVPPGPQQPSLAGSLGPDDTFSDNPSATPYPISPGCSAAGWRDPRLFTRWPAVYAARLRGRGPGRTPSAGTSVAPSRRAGWVPRCQTRTPGALLALTHPDSPETPRRARPRSPARSAAASPALAAPRPSGERGSLGAAAGAWDRMGRAERPPRGAVMGTGAVMAAEAGPGLAARVAFRAEFGARGARLPGGAGGGAQRGGGEEEGARAARTRQRDSAPSAASARGRGGRLGGGGRGLEGRGPAGARGPGGARPARRTGPLPGPPPRAAGPGLAPPPGLPPGPPPGLSVGAPGRGPAAGLRPAPYLCLL